MSWSVIIPSKNAGNLIPCVSSIWDNEVSIGGPLPGNEVIVVDDGIDYLKFRERYPGCFAPVSKWVEGVQPFIFSRNINLGIAAAGENDVILLNDDTILRTNEGFSLLSSVAKSAPEYGVVSAACNNATPWQAPAGSKSIREVERVVSFVCVFISRETINKIGLLDERFTEYGWEDNDYCHRVELAGLKLGVFDGCVIDHCLDSTFRGGQQARDIAPGARIYHNKWGDDLSLRISG